MKRFKSLGLLLLTLMLLTVPASAQFSGRSGIYVPSASSGGTPGAPGLSCQGADVSATAFVAIPNCTFDASTGDVTLGAGLTVNSTDGVKLSDNSLMGILIEEIATEPGEGISINDFGDGIYLQEFSADAVILLRSSGSGQFATALGLYFLDSGTSGIHLDTSQSGGTGPISLTSAGGVPITDNSASGITFVESGAGPFTFNGNPILAALVGTTSASGAMPTGSTVLATGGGSGITLAMPALADGVPLTVKKVDSGAGSVTISGTIDGNASGYVLTNQYQYVTLINYSSNIYVIGNN